MERVRIGAVKDECLLVNTCMHVQCTCLYVCNVYNYICMYVCMYLYVSMYIVHLCMCV